MDAKGIGWGLSVGGLKPEIVDSIRMFKHKSLREIINLVRMRDEQLACQKRCRGSQLLLLEGDDGNNDEATDEVEQELT
ncbi:hypothetical protein Pint_10784 [Pistacia integerrima]|uniref:Uncharacterized protein n=1 Tax=Pistacia integerrima TaxID=434235 RepID=A0ACC0XK01_9ROSI|nr:hypothetical protein Pint_10784 [Pistacia integerrima]